MYDKIISKTYFVQLLEKNICVYSKDDLEFM